MKEMAPLEEQQGAVRTAAARPSMISAKYRQKEERRKVLKMSVGKLRRIEDPESALRRSVLINNTVRRLQREQREAKLERVAPPSPEPQPPPPQQPLAVPVAAVAPRDDWSLEPLEQAAGMVLDELEDVLSQFYMPPTPRMITSIDEDDELETDSSSPSLAPSSASTCSPGRRPSSGPRPPSKRARFERVPQDRVEDEDARALADPTNTLEDFKDDVCIRSKLLPLPRTPLSSANAPSEDALRPELCVRRFTGHDRENIAPLLDASLTIPASPPAGTLASGGGAAGAGAGAHLCSGAGPGAGAAALGGGGAGVGAGAVSGGQVLSLPMPMPGGLQVQPYSCGQAHGQVSMQAGLGFHGFMATMES